MDKLEVLKLPTGSQGLYKKMKKESLEGKNK